MKRHAVLGLLSLILSSCAYNVQPVSTKAINIYSAYETKIPGAYALIIDDSVRNVNREIAPVSYVCSAHRYPIAVGDSLAVSVKQTLDSVFEQVIEQRTLPSSESLSKVGLNGTILVKLDDFSSRILCTQGFFRGTCTASTDISFGVTVRGISESLFATAASGSKTADGDAGGACGGGAEVIADSITRATRDALERLAERLSNSTRLRGTRNVAASPAVVASSNERQQVNSDMSTASVKSVQSTALNPAERTPVTKTHATLVQYDGPKVKSGITLEAEFVDDGSGSGEARVIYAGNRYIIPGKWAKAEPGKAEAPKLIDKKTLNAIRFLADVPLVTSKFTDDSTVLECLYGETAPLGQRKGECQDNYGNKYHLVITP